MFTVVIVFVDGLYFSDASVLTLLLPDEESTKVINLSAFVLLSSLIATCDAAPADKLPAFIHLVSVPSDDNTCPLLPKLLSPSRNWPSNLIVLENLAISLNVLNHVTLKSSLIPTPKVEPSAIIPLMVFCPSPTLGSIKVLQLAIRTHLQL